MNLKMIQRIINSNNKLDVDMEINKISTNSKEIESNDIFLVLNSGYLYIEEAIKRGAIAIITDIKNLEYDIPTLEVEDAKKTLKTLASYYRSQYIGKIIAITGSNGKTTTKELLSYVLSKKYKVLSNPQSQNNLLGISQTLLKLNNDYDYVVLELGMNHKGEISELSHLVKPDIGIITNIGSSHIGYLGSRENIFKAKMEILDGNSSMELYINGNDEYLKNVTDAIKYFPDQYFENVNSTNSAAVFKVSQKLGFKDDEIIELINNFRCIDSRMEKHYIDNHLVIDDAYNASYESFVYGLENLKKYKMRKVVIFGDMLELGSYSAFYHRLVFDEINKLDDVVIITVGQETKVLNNEYHFHDLETLQAFLENFKWYDNDVIYIKASHRLNLSNLISFFKNMW